MHCIYRQEQKYWWHKCIKSVKIFHQYVKYIIIMHGSRIFSKRGCGVMDIYLFQGEWEFKSVFSVILLCNSRNLNFTGGEGWTPLPWSAHAYLTKIMNSVICQLYIYSCINWRYNCISIFCSLSTSVFKCTLLHVKKKYANGRVLYKHTSTRKYIMLMICIKMHWNFKISQ